MTKKKSTLWGNIFTDLVDDNGCYEVGEVNFYQLASHLEQLYIQNAELRNRIEQMEATTKT